MAVILAIDISDDQVHVGLVNQDGTVHAAGARNLPSLRPGNVISLYGDEDWLGALMACCDQVRTAYPTSEIVAVGLAGQATQLVSEERFSDKTLAVTPTLADLLDVPVGTPMVLAAGGRAALLDALHGHQVGAGMIHLGPTPWVAALTEASVLSDMPAPDGTELEPAFPGFNVLVAFGHRLAQAREWARTTWLPELSTNAANDVLMKAGGGAMTSRLAITDLGHGTYAVTGMNARTKAWQIYQAAYEYVAFGLATFADRIGMDSDVIPLSGVPITHPVWPQLIADIFNRPVAAIHTQHAGLLGCVRTVTDALGWPIPNPLGREGILVSPGPRARDYAVLRQANQQVGARLASIRWPF